MSINVLIIFMVFLKSPVLKLNLSPFLSKDIYHVQTYKTLILNLAGWMQLICRYISEFSNLGI